MIMHHCQQYYYYYEHYVACISMAVHYCIQAVTSVGSSCRTCL